MGKYANSRFMVTILTIIAAIVTYLNLKLLFDIIFN